MPYVKYPVILCCWKFYSQTCYDMHKEKKICDSIVQCPMCRKEFEPSVSKEPHQCYFDKCFVCHKYVKLTEHKCFIQPVAPKEDQRKKKPKQPWNATEKKNPLALVWCFKFVYSFLWIAFCIVLRVVFVNSGTFFKFGQCSFCILTIGYMIALLQGMHLLITHALDLGLVV